MKKLLLFFVLGIVGFVPAGAQLYKGGYTLVYSTETPDSLAKDLGRELTAEEEAACKSDFVSEESMLKNWQYCERLSSNWNKRIAKTDAQRHNVNVFDGAYHAFAKEDATEASTAANGWVTGAIHMRNAIASELSNNGTAESPVDCIIEVKAKSNPFASNWTGIWMMPTSTENWPDGGELDIVEEVGKSGELWTVLHLEARDGKWSTEKNAVVSSEASTALSGKYTFYTSNTKYGGGLHVYSLRKTRNYIVIYVDGEQFFKYTKDWSLDFDAHPTFEHAQYPYDQPFYMILNQSVGFNEGWGGAEPTKGHTYESDFSYVRYYRKAASGAQCVKELEAGVEYAIQDVMTGLYVVPEAPDGTVSATKETAISLADTASVFTLEKPSATAATWYIKSKNNGKYLKYRSTNKDQAMFTTKSSALKWTMTYDTANDCYTIYQSGTNGFGAPVAQPGKGVYIQQSGGLWRIVKYEDIPSGISDIVSHPAEQQTGARKEIQNGRLVIVKDGRTYGVDGRRIE